MCAVIARDVHPASIDCAGLGVRHLRADVWRPEASTWRAEPGSRTLLLGPSGCGKSTLALALTGLVPGVLPAQLRGDVRVGGRSVRTLPLHDLTAAVSIVFQDPDAQLFTETVFDEVCFALENRLLPVAEIEARATAAIRAMGLEDLAEVNPRTLSGGQKQRVAIACVLAGDASVLVLDEPTANLDPAARRDFYRTLGELPGQDERSVVLIEHNVDDALEFVNRVVVLGRDGDVVTDGTPREVFTQHRDLLDAEGVWQPLATQAFRRLPAQSGEPPLYERELAVCLAQLQAQGASLRPPDVTDRSNMDTAVEVAGLACHRRRERRAKPQRVLDDVTFTIPEGAFAAIVGVNGAGKSTLLQVLAGLLPITDGSVLVHGRPVRRRGRSPIGLVFQNPEHQFIEPTVAEELTAAADPTLTDADRSKRVDELLDRFGLAEAAGRHPSMLSGGQKRRLSVGMALIGGHRVIAFDEPTFGQDADSAAELLTLMSELHHSGVTVLAVTHDLQLVADYATDVVVLAEGTVSANGDAADVLRSGAVEQAGLRPPPLAEVAASLPDGALRSITRLSDLDRIGAVTAR